MPAESLRGRWVSELLPQFWAFCGALKIPSKEEGVIFLRPTTSQVYLITEIFTGLDQGIHDFVTVKSRQLGACLLPSTRVLTSDLRWVPMETVRPGDTLLGVDESPEKRGAARKMREAKVEATNEVEGLAVRLTMDNGATLTATPEHRFLCRARGTVSTCWRSVRNLQVGDDIRVIARPWQAPDYEDGWFSGLLDGEGSMSRKSQAGTHLGISQVPGDVLHRARLYLTERGYVFREEVDRRDPGTSSKYGKKPVVKLIVGRMNDIFRLIGQTRPARFISRDWWEGKELPPGKRLGVGYAKIVGIKSLTVRRMIDLQTSTGTYIAEGFVSHNSTILWALDLWWFLKFGSIQAMYIADDDENKEVHRNILTQMYESLPPKFSRGPFQINNRVQAQWADRPGWRSPRIMWTHASPRQEGQLGRSRGVNYLHGEEIDGWKDRKGVDALTSSLATDYPFRLYLWVGTGQGYGLLYEMWEQSGESVTSRQVFLGWWRLSTRRVTKAAQPDVWNVYGITKPSPDETEWLREVRKRYGVIIDREQLCWWRWQLHEGKGINGDEAKMLQEHPWLPEQAFQSSGSQFLSPTVLLKMHHAFARAPQPVGYRYDWGLTFDEKFTPDGDQTILGVPLEQAALTVWEHPDPAGLYVVSGDPAYGSSEKADRFAVTVWRCWPDSLVQVAEYQTPVGTMYQFAWTLAHLAGSYPRWLIYDVNGPGSAVLQELKRMQDLGFGLTVRGNGIHDVVSRIQTYLWARPDALMSSYSWGWKTSGGNVEQLMEQLRDMCERGMLVVRSRALWSELGALRRDGGKIEAGGVAHDDLAVTAAMAVEYWLSSIVQEIEQWMAPKDAIPTAKTDPTQRLVRGFMARMNQGEEEPPRQYGVRVVAPGR